MWGLVQTPGGEDVGEERVLPSLRFIGPEYRPEFADDM